MTTRVALIGANGHGLSHRRALAAMSTVQLVAIADVAPVQDPPDGVPAYPSHTRLLAEVAPDIVIVCTPPHTHLAIATDALRAGADVLLEKPPVLDAAEHRCLERVLAETGRSCQVGFQALASPALAQLLSTMDSASLSSIAAVGAWKRDEAYFTRSAWVGRSTVGGHPTLDLNVGVVF